MDAKKASDVALLNAIGVVIAKFVWNPLALITGILAVITGIAGLRKINQEKATKGKWKCIVAIVVGALGILLGVLSMVLLPPTGRPPR